MLCHLVIFIKKVKSIKPLLMFSWETYEFFKVAQDAYKNFALFTVADLQIVSFRTATLSKRDYNTGVFL